VKLCSGHVTQPAAEAARRSRPYPESGRPAPCERGPRCTTERPNTHNPGVLEVCYPWHPWYGQQVQVQAVRGRNGLRVMRCTPCERPRLPGLEIPRWMCDPVIRGRCVICIIVLNLLPSPQTPG